MQIVNQRYEAEHPLAAVREHPENVNVGDDEAVGALIDANGFYGAIVVQESTRLILAGNTRYRAALAAGAETMPMMFVDVDDDEALRIMLGDNESARSAKTDTERLAALLGALSTTERGLDGTGYQDDDLSALLESLSPPVPLIGPNDGVDDGEWGRSATKTLAFSLPTADAERISATLARVAETDGVTTSVAFMHIVDAFEGG